MAMKEAVGRETQSKAEGNRERALAAALSQIERQFGITTAELPMDFAKLFAS